jgi:DNA-binding HxlR family transcriptional regulator
LEGSQLIDRTMYPAVPPHVEYSLTPLGDAGDPLAALRSWAEEHLDDIIAPQAAS